LGVRLEGCEGGTFRGIKFIADGRSVAAEFPLGAGIGIRRLHLHRKLVEHAEHAGVEFRWGARVHTVDGTMLMNGLPTSSTWIVGADGRHSQVRQWAGLSTGRDRGQRIGMRRHFQVPLWSDFVEVYWGDEGQAYVTPVGKNEVCIALISRERFSSFDKGIAQFSELANRLKDGLPITKVMGAVTPTLRLKSVVRGNIALIGEASGSVDAITGEGLGMAFRQATALGKALKASDLSLYEAAHRAIAKLPNAMSQSLLMLDKNPWGSRAWRSIMMRFLNVTFLLFLWLAMIAHAEEKLFEFDPVESHIEYKVDSTLHTVHGTFKLKQGEIHVDPATGQAGGDLVVDATSGDSGNKSRDRKMNEKVLESQTYPEMTFTLQQVKGRLDKDGPTALELDGIMTVHGQSHPMSFLCQANIKGDTASADLSFEIPYVKWGMKNPSVFLLHVSDAVEMTIHVAGRFSH